MAKFPTEEGPFLRAGQNEGSSGSGRSVGRGWFSKISRAIDDWKTDRMIEEWEKSLSPEEKAELKWEDYLRLHPDADPNFYTALRFCLDPPVAQKPPDWDEAFARANDYCHNTHYGGELPPPHPLWRAPAHRFRHKTKPPARKVETMSGTAPDRSPPPLSARAFSKEYLDACWLLGLTGDCTRDQLDKRYAAMIRTARSDARRSDSLAALLDDARDRVCAFQGWVK